MAPVRMGILGAADRKCGSSLGVCFPLRSCCTGIAPQAVIRPAQANPELCVIAAVAARDEARAQEFAEKHGIATVHSSYEDLINDPEIDAIYNPAPNGLHAEWTILALLQGKAVLCEKPLCSNAEEARVMEEARVRSRGVAVEASHWSYHPQLQQMRAWLCDEGRGPITRWEVTFSVPEGAMPLDDVRCEHSNPLCHHAVV